ncbi:MAG: rRNA adenine N-6-methyltransferase family protein, partial [Eubacterium callanderi]
YVPAAVFMPRPKVDSIVVTLKKRAEPAIRVSDKKLFFQIVKASFLNRRKTLINGLQMNTDYSKERLLNALEKCGIAPGVRGETLTGEDFARLANTLSGE